MKLFTIIFIILSFLSCTHKELTRKKFIKRYVNIKNFKNLDNSSKKITFKLWWYNFNDTDLNNLIAKALKKNYNLKLAEKNIHLARLNYYIERTSLSPYIYSSGKGIRYKKYLRGLPKFIPPQIKETQYSLNIDLNYELDFWRKNYLKTLTKKEMIILEKYKREIIEDTLISDVVSIYFELIKLNTLKKIYEKIKFIKIEKKKSFYLKFLNGFIPISYLKKINTEISDIENVIITLNNEIENLIYTLNVLTGEIPEKKLIIDKNWNFKQPEIPALLPSNALLNRPDINISIAKIFINEKLVDIAKKEYFPKFTLTSQYGYESGKVSNLIKNLNSLYSLSLNFVQSVFDFGKRRNLVKISKTQLKIANIEFKKTILNALLEIESSLNSYKNALIKRKKINKKFKNLQELLQIKKLKFEKNEDSIENILTLKESILFAKIELINEEKEIYDYAIKSYKALGLSHDKENF